MSAQGTVNLAEMDRNKSPRMVTWFEFEQREIRTPWILSVRWQTGPQENQTDLVAIAAYASEENGVRGVQWWHKRRREMYQRLGWGLVYETRYETLLGRSTIGGAGEDLTERLRLTVCRLREE